MHPKADAADFLGRFREIVSDPLNLLIKRHPLAGTTEDHFVYLHNGNQVPLSGPQAYYGDFSNILVINRGVHEPLEEYVFQELLRVLPERPSMLELGAYWAHYSMWLQLARPRSRVFLVEPEAENIQVGRSNFARHNYRGEFFQDFVGKGHLEVDPFLKSQSVEGLDILHADIQGFEGELFDGCAQSLRGKSINYLFVSTHSQQLHAEVVGRLIRAEYRVEVESDVDWRTTSFDGFVFASSPAAPAVFNSFQPLGRTDIIDSEPARLVQALAEMVRHSHRVRPGPSAPKTDARFRKACPAENASR